MLSARIAPLMLAGWTAALLFVAAIAVSRAGAAGIRDIAWLDFTYVVNGESVTVVGGQFVQANPPLLVAVSQPVFGDLTGDGEEEAVMITAVNYGGSGTFTEALVYTLSDGEPVVAGTIPGGDRAYGGIQSLTIADGRVLLNRNQPAADGPACCPSYTATESWGFQGGLLGEFVGSRFISPFEPVASAEE